MKDQIKADEAYFGGKRKGNRGRGAKNMMIVFDILERNDSVKVEIIKDAKAKILLADTIKNVRKGALCTLISGVL